MILLTNGCSWSDPDTFDGLVPNLATAEKKFENTWPAILGKLLGAEEVINLSTGCGSNQRIMRTTFNWISQQDYNTLKKCIIIIQWTEFSRYEYYFPLHSSREWENFDDRWALAKANLVQSKEINKKQAETRNRQRLLTYTKEEAIYNFTFLCMAMKSLCSNYKIPLYFWHLSNDLATFPAWWKKYHLDNFNWLDGSNDWVYERLQNDPHPSPNGQKTIAEIIHNQLKHGCQRFKTKRLRKLLQERA